MQGTLINFHNMALTIKPDNGPEVTVAVDDEATVVRDGQPASLDDLEKGDLVTVSGNPVVSISAVSKA